MRPHTSPETLQATPAPSLTLTLTLTLAHSHSLPFRRHTPRPGDTEGLALQFPRPRGGGQGVSSRRSGEGGAHPPRSLELGFLGVGEWGEGVSAEKRGL